MLEAVIFDMDGTILNTLEDLKDSVNFVLSKHNFPQRTLDEIRMFVGNGVKPLFERALPKNTETKITEKCIEDFKEHYSQITAGKTAPYKGVIEILKDLKKSNIKTAVVSNKFDTAVKSLSKKYFPDLIDIAVGQSDNIPQKPSPEAVFKVINDLQIKSAIFVGDSDVDIKTAKNAGLKSIGVTWGFRDRNNLFGADFIVDTPDELIKTIRSL